MLTVVVVEAVIVRTWVGGQTKPKVVLPWQNRLYVPPLRVRGFAQLAVMMLMVRGGVIILVVGPTTTVVKAVVTVAVPGRNPGGRVVTSVTGGKVGLVG
jgi:hypothetical protein